MSTRQLICIGCPLGCALTVEMDDSIVTSVSGYSCKIGLDYAHRECTHPTRIITTTLPICDGTHERIPVKTKEPIPKEKIAQLMASLKDVTLTAPIAMGDHVLENVVDTGIPLVATQTVLIK